MWTSTATEVLGGLAYRVTSGPEPMFTVTNGKLGASIAEVSYGTPPYSVLVTETRNGITRQLNRGQAPLRYEFLGGSSALPLFVAAP